jgi:hypothetical protein
MEKEKMGVCIDLQRRDTLDTVCEGSKAVTVVQLKRAIKEEVNFSAQKITGHRSRVTGPGAIQRYLWTAHSSHSRTWSVSSYLLDLVAVLEEALLVMDPHRLDHHHDHGPCHRHISRGSRPLDPT